MLDYFSKLNSDEAFRCREFPIVSREIYLANAGVCPLPRCVADAMAEYADQACLGDQEAAAGAVVGSTRQRAAELLDVSVEEVALIGSTSNALSLIANGFPFESGDNMIVYRDDYPSNVYPWLALREKGVEVRFVDSSGGLGVIEPSDVLRHVDQRTRLVALASCHFLSGCRLDLDGIGRVLRERQVAFCVDGIQTVGAFETSLEYVDFMAADSHKWLLGPCAAGILYVAKPWLERLRVTCWGWHNVACPGFVAADSLEFPEDARRFEPGTANLMGLVGLERSLRMLLEVGISTIAADLTTKRNRIRARLQQLGCEVLLPELPMEKAGGMISFSPSRDAAREVFAHLSQAGVRGSLRQERSGKAWLRFSPHFYNTDSELDRALSCLEDSLQLSRP